MWSNYVWYFMIRSDEKYASAIQTEQVIKILNNKNLFLQVGTHSFKERPGLPSLHLSCIYSVDGNFGSPASMENEWCTMIDVQAPKSTPDSFHYFKNILTEIARDLSWELIIEEDDDCNEHVILFSPLD